MSQDFGPEFLILSRLSWIVLTSTIFFLFSLTGWPPTARAAAALRGIRARDRARDFPAGRVPTYSFTLMLAAAV